MKSLLLILIINILLFIQSGESCTQDYECSGPYGICQNRFNVFPGIALDQDSGSVLFMGKFNGSYGPIGKTYITSVPINGGNLKIEYPILSDIPTYPDYTEAYELIDYYGPSKTPYIQSWQVGAPSCGTYDRSNGKFSKIWTIRGYNLGLYLDAANQRTYYCDYGLHRLNKIATNQSDKESAIDLYTEVRCTGIGVKGNDIYVASNYYGANNVTSRIYRGTIDCVKCPIYNLQLVVDIPHGEFTHFQMSSTHFYLSTKTSYTNSENGIYSIPISGDLVALRFIVSDPVINFVVDKDQQFVYYQTDSRVIKKASIPGNHPVITTLYDSSQSAGGQGTCQCLDGFSGSNCQTCNGIVRWYSAYPTCVALNPDGTPTQCYADWECMNPPYTICQTQHCTCATGFTGSRCTQCDGTVEWNNGVPTCKK